MTGLAALFLVALFWLTPTVAAQDFSGCTNNGGSSCDVTNVACDGVSGSPLCDTQTQTQGSNSIFGRDGVMTKAARVIAMMVGVAAVIMVIIGGIQYVISSGDPANTKNAKNTILYAIIGLVIASLAQGIIQFVLVRL